MAEYFILTKPCNTDICDDSNNDIIIINKNTYILPKNILNYYSYNGLFEKHLIDWCKQFCDKTKNILDIGAHSGTYTVSLANKFNHVYAFEPQKMTYYALCGSVALSNLQNVTCLNYGLGSHKQVGRQLLNIGSIDGGCSSLHNNENKNIIKKEEIEVRTLDSFNIINIGFIKMDVEDNELEVLKGSCQTLKKSGYPKILFEMNKLNEELLCLFKELNYRIICINGYKNMFLAEQ